MHLCVIYLAVCFLHLGYYMAYSIDLFIPLVNFFTSLLLSSSSLVFTPSLLGLVADRPTIKPHSAPRGQQPQLHNHGYRNDNDRSNPRRKNPARSRTSRTSQTPLQMDPKHPRRRRDDPSSGPSTRERPGRGFSEGSDPGWS